MSRILPEIQAINKTLLANSGLVTAATQSALAEMQLILNGYKAGYQEVRVDLNVLCYSITGNLTRVPDSTYEEFAGALCGSALVGLDASWLMQIVTFLFLIPMAIVALKAFKLISYAVLVSDDLLPSF